jgi:LPXTG-motif cell wall-anchored protein
LYIIEATGEGTTHSSINLSIDPLSVPGPIVGAGLPGLIAAGAAFMAWKRRKTRLS